MIYLTVGERDKIRDEFGISPIVLTDMDVAWLNGLIPTEKGLPHFGRFHKYHGFPPEIMIARTFRLYPELQRFPLARVTPEEEINRIGAPVDPLDRQLYLDKGETVLRTQEEAADIRILDEPAFSEKKRPWPPGKRVRMNDSVSVPLSTFTSEELAEAIADGAEVIDGDQTPAEESRIHVDTSEVRYKLTPVGKDKVIVTDTNPDPVEDKVEAIAAKMKEDARAAIAREREAEELAASQAALTARRDDLVAEAHYPSTLNVTKITKSGPGVLLSELNIDPPIQVGPGEMCVVHENGTVDVVPIPSVERKGEKHDQDKPSLELIPPGTMTAIAIVMTQCLTRENPYKVNSWKNVGPVHRWTGALMRHLDAILDGQEFDEDSGLSHISHVLTCAAIMNCNYELGKSLIPPDCEPEKSPTVSE